MTKPWDNIETNSRKIFKILEIKGRLTPKELAGRARLTELQCFYAAQGGQIVLREGYYQLVASPYAHYLESRLWNKSVLDGAMA